MNTSAAALDGLYNYNNNNTRILHAHTHRVVPIKPIRQQGPGRTRPCVCLRLTYVCLGGMETRHVQLFGECAECDG